MLVIVLVILAISPGTARRVNAEPEPSCTKEYAQCIEEAAKIDNPILREMANIECFADWVGCVGRKIIVRK